MGDGRAEKVDGRALTLLALGRSVEADIGTFRIARRRSGRTFASPMLRLTVDGAKETRTWMMGGGGGGEDELIWRMAWELAPTPRDRTFVIEVSQIDWTRHDRGEQRIETVESGPWRFQITLP